MALIPSESYSFPDHFVQTVGNARRATRQLPAASPDPEPETKPTTAELRETERPQQPIWSGWWPFNKSRELPSELSTASPPPDWQNPEIEIEPVASDESILPVIRAEAEMRLSEPEIIPQPEIVPEPEIVTDPLVAESPGWVPVESAEWPTFQEPIVQETAVESVELAAFQEAIVQEPPIEPTLPPELEPVVNESTVAPLVEPEKSNGISEEETPAPRIFIPSLVPSTLKRKVRWNMRAAQAQQNSTANDDGNGSNGANLHANTAPAESHATPPQPPKPKPDIRPKISLVPAPLEAEEKPVAPSPVVPDNIVLPDESGSRTVEAPSADLIQTLLARALFGSTETAEPPRPQSEPQRNHVIHFAPAPAVSTKGHSTSAVSAKKMAAAARQKIETLIPRTVDQALSLERKRHGSKLRRFIICEAIALGLLVPLALVGVLRVFRDPTVVLVIDVITITAAVAATLMPILFFAIAPPLPRGEE